MQFSMSRMMIIVTFAMITIMTVIENSITTSTIKISTTAITITYFGSLGVPKHLLHIHNQNFV